MPPRRIHIVGRKNAGKTTLIVELVGELCRRGLSVGTVKHTSHRHELDVPGKDSWRHRQAGAAPVAVLSRGVTAVFMPGTSDTAAYESIAPFYADCDVVLVEGWQAAQAIKLEVWRADLEEAPLACWRRDIAAVITDDRVEVSVPVWPRADVSRLADLVLAVRSQCPV